MEEKLTEAQKLLDSRESEHAAFRDSKNQECENYRNQIASHKEELRTLQQLADVLDSLSNTGAFGALSNFSHLGQNLSDRRHGRSPPSRGVGESGSFSGDVRGVSETVRGESEGFGTNL